MEWQQYYDTETGKYYYYNLKTFETTWTIPSSFIPVTAATEEDDTDINIDTSAPVNLKFDWGSRQMAHYFNVNDYQISKNTEVAVKKEKPKKLTKKQILEYKKKKVEKKRKRNQWLFD